MVDRLYTFVEAGEALGTSRQVVAALAKAHGIQPQPVPRNGAAKGLTEADMRVLRKALGLPVRRPRSAQPLV